MNPYQPPPYQPQYQKSNRSKTALFLGIAGGCCLFVILGFGVFIYVSYLTLSKTITQVAQSNANSQKDLVVLEHKRVIFQGKQYIAGTMRNNSLTDKYDLVSITFNLTDKSGNLVGIATESRTDKPLKPKEIWRFKAEISIKGVANYTLGYYSGTNLPFDFLDSSDSQPVK